MIRQSIIASSIEYQKSGKLLRNIGLSIAVALYVAMYVAGASSVLPTQEKDAMTVLQLATTAQFVEGEGSYYYAALVSSYLSPWMQQGLVISLGLGFILTVFLPLRGVSAVGVAVVLIAAPIILFLTLFVKDTFIIPLTIATVVISVSSRRWFVKVLVIAALYIIYAFFFRKYYILIAVVFALLVLMSRISLGWRLLIFLAFLTVLFLLPDEYYYQLQISRDLFNYRRLGRDIAGARTAFGNYLPPGDVFSFFVNYFYALMRLNFSFLFTLDIRELFLSMNIFIYAFLAWLGVRSGADQVRIPTLLFAAHFCVLMLFEPDLGSYFRHVSSVLPYLVPALVVLDRMRAGHRTSPDHGRALMTGGNFVRRA